MGYRILRATLGQCRGSLVGFSQLAPVHPVDDQLRGGCDQVRIERERPLQCRVGVLEGLLTAIRVVRVVVVALAEFRPGRGVIWIQVDRAFQTLDSLSSGS